MLIEEVFMREGVVTSLGLGVLVIGEPLQMGLPLNEDMVVIEDHVIETTFWVNLWGVNSLGQDIDRQSCVMLLTL